MIPGAVTPPVLAILVCYIVYGSFGDPDFQGSFRLPDFRCHFCQNYSWKSVKTLDMESVGLDRQMARCQGQMILGVGKPSHCQGQRIPGVVKPLVFPISVCIVHGYFGDLNFQGHFCQNDSWTPIKTLAREPIGPNGKIGLLSWSNETRSK
ncbi:hypothetical protein H5410_056440 [Solanum commersonii]|uniref:Uncharacterized protein n=1 Tax=Solanum commersonii TaxID=4109 RepID=A0A9J5WLA8_SOLCO|nr:hypothetical protein H5410_056440 [Solanum commersonii]